MVKCPKCGREVDEWENECPYCKTNFEKYNRGEISNRNHAYWLNIFAIINIVLCIIASIIIFINFSCWFFKCTTCHTFFISHL